MTTQTSSPVKNKWTMYLLPIAGIAMLFVAGVHEYYSAYEASASKHWPTVEGRVIKSQWIEHKGKGCPYWINFSYSYNVGHRSLIGDNFRFGGECSFSDVSYITSNYPVGSEVIVHYDPENPGTSVIIPGSFSSNASLGLYLWPILLIMCIALLIQVKRGKILPRR